MKEISNGLDQYREQYEQSFDGMRIAHFERRIVKDYKFWREK
jgi:hypothetical protein